MNINNITDFQNFLTELSIPRAFAQVNKHTVLSAIKYCAENPSMVLPLLDPVLESAKNKERELQEFLED